MSPILASFGNAVENGFLIAGALALGLLAERALGVTTWFFKRK